MLDRLARIYGHFMGTCILAALATLGGMHVARTAAGADFGLALLLTAFSAVATAIAAWVTWEVWKESGSHD